MSFRMVPSNSILEHLFRVSSYNIKPWIFHYCSSLLPIVINTSHLRNDLSDTACRGYFYGISDFGSGAGHQCQSAFTSTSSTLLYISPVLNDNAWYSTDGASTTTATASPIYNVYGDGIPVWWQSSDLAAFAAATGQPTTPTNSPTSSSRTTTSSTPSSTPPARTNSLTSGAKIGIGVGIPIVVIALGILAFIWFKRSRHRNSIVHPEVESAAVDKYPQEVPADGPIRQELYSDSDPYQYGQARRRAELPGPEQGVGA
jgi:hypothetical protein